MRRAPIIAAVFALLALAGCKREAAQTAHPALWEVSGPSGARAWVFGTVHALPADLAWQSPAIDGAVAASDTIVLEVAGVDDGPAARDAFLRLGTTPGQPPLADRVSPPLREALRAAMARTRLDPGQFANLEDWAAALTLSLAVESDEGYDNANGADKALLAKAGKRPVVGLETIEGQLGVFDALPAPAQRALLDSVVAETTDKQESARLIKAWSDGDMAAMDREAHGGMLADERLRGPLLVQRNRAWAAAVERMMREGHHPFVAVGAAHVAGIDGLPALLGARGFTVKRVQ